jgi:class 3 adenylate cyclase
VERKLAAIMAADVVGYSRLIGADEEGTLARLKALRRELFEPEVRKHRGRIVKLMGDGILAEFASVVDAVQCAVDIQEGVGERGKDVSEDRQVGFRVGINVGDVVIEGEDIHGDGVNVAARLESLANPGGLCVSNAVHEQVRDRLRLSFDDMGDQRMKNMNRPVRVWRWPSVSGADRRGPDKLSARSDRPTLIVTPFKNLSDEPEQAYLAEGIGEDVVTGLSKNAGLRVIFQNADTAAQFAEGDANITRQVQDSVFHLEGSVRQHGRRIRITAQLIDVGTGSRIWAERFDREMGDMFELQDEVVGSIVHALGAADGVIEASTRQTRMESSSDGNSAYDSYLKGRYYFYKHGDSDFDKAEESFLKAIELDGNFAPAYSALAWLCFVQFKLFRSKTFEEIRPRAFELALGALRLDKQEFRAHWVLGGIYLHDGNHAQSIAEFDKALRINPNDANLLSWSAEALVYAGHLREALERCEQAIKLNPNCPDWYHWIKASALFHQGDYEEALAALNNMSAPGHAGRLKATILAYLGHLEEARAEAEAFMKLVPAFSIDEWAQTEHYADPAELERYVEGQRRAGLPD